MKKRDDILEHLTRPQLIRAAGQRPVEWDRHLQKCHECRSVVELLGKYPVSGRILLPEPPDGWVHKAVAIPQKATSFSPLRRLKAALVFDSWAAPQVVGVRGSGSHSDRRLKFESEGITLDMRAENHGELWSFVAHVSGYHAEQGNIECGGRELTPNTHGLIQWESVRPPTTLTVRTPKVAMEVSRIRWNKTGRK